MTRSIILISSCLTLFIGCNGGSDTGATAPDGAALYDSKCLACHGEEGDGRDTPLAESVPILTDAEIEDTIRNGNDEGMPAALVSDDDEIAALIDYLRERWGG